MSQKYPFTFFDVRCSYPTDNSWFVLDGGGYGQGSLKRLKMLEAVQDSLPDDFKGNHVNIMNFTKCEQYLTNATQAKLTTNN